MVDHRDPVRQPVGLVEVLRRQQDGGALRDQVAHRVPHLVATARVEPAGRLVQEQHPWREDHARRQVQPAPHSPAVLLDALVGGVHQVELLEQLDGARLGPLGAEVEQPAEHLQVLPAGEDLVDRGVLAGETDAPPHLEWSADDVEPADHRTSAVRPDEGGEDPHGSRLASAVGAEQSVDRAVRNREVEAVQGALLAVALLQTFRENRHVRAGHRFLHRLN